MLIDIHSHLIPDSLPEGPPDCGDGLWPRIEDAGPDARVLVAGKSRFTTPSVFFDAERKLAAMDASGVDAEVISPLPPMLQYTVSPEHGRALCDYVNEFTAALCTADPGRLIGFGTVPLQDPDLAAAALSGIRDMGLAGVEIGSNIAGRSLGEERFLGFFAEAERLRIPVFVHPVGPAIGDRLPMQAMMTFGYAADIALAAASIISSGTAERCPGLQLAFSHGGGGMPLTLPRAQYFWSGSWNEAPSLPGREQPGRLSKPPSEYARRFYYDTLVFDRRAIRYLLDMIGPSQLLVGSDFPAQPREQPAASTLREMDLPAVVLEDITWRNAMRFLGRPYN